MNDSLTTIHLEFRNSKSSSGTHRSVPELLNYKCRTSAWQFNDSTSAVPELKLQFRNSWLKVKDHCVGRSDAKWTVPELTGAAQSNWWSDFKRQTESLRWSRLQPAHPHTTGDEGQKEWQTSTAVRHCMLRRTVIDAAMTNDSVLTVSCGWSCCWDPYCSN